MTAGILVSIRISETGSKVIRALVFIVVLGELKTVCWKQMP